MDLSPFQMIRDYKERDKQPLDYKFKSFEPDVNSQHFRIVNCGCLREKESSTRKEPNEYDLVILRGGDEYITEAFGVVEEVEKTSLRDDEGRVLLVYVSNLVTTLIAIVLQPSKDIS